MTAEIIDGKAIAAELRADIAKQAESFFQEHGRRPGLAVVLIGDNPASEVYVRNKIKATETAGMLSVEKRLPDTVTQQDVIELVKELNADATVDGILVQLPLPKPLDADEIINHISPEKDVDGLTPLNMGRLAMGQPGMVPCTPQGSLILIKRVLGEDLTGKNALVIGRSNLFGKPMAQLLLAEDCTVTMAHSRTNNLPELCKAAEILVVAVGRAGMIQGSWVRKGATVIDVGINRMECPETGRSVLRGDVDFDPARENADFITPVPGGVGPMTIACLLRNTIKAACTMK